MAKQHQNELKEAFSLFDRKGKNCVDITDLGNLVRSVGLSPSQADVITMQSEFEKSGKRSIDLKEFMDLISKHQNLRETPDNIREAFRTFDKEGNGLIYAAELRHVLTSLGERLTDEEVDELIREADITSDGQVNYEDFVRTLLMDE